MSDIPALAPDRILRFHAPDKVFHSLNAITWFALLFTGMYVYFLNPSDEAAETAMLIHLILGAVFTFNLLGFIVIAPDRFALIMRACLEWDRNTIYWFRNFGGYPRRFFKIPFGPVEVPPQGRYNGGQKASYLLFMGMIAALAVTGWLLWIGAPVTASLYTGPPSISTSGVQSSSQSSWFVLISRSHFSRSSTSRASGVLARAPSRLKQQNTMLRSGSNEMLFAPISRSNVSMPLHFSSFT